MARPFRAALLCIFLCITFTTALSLSDFNPKVSGLPAACDDVYTSPIRGCSESDFRRGTCSASCINGLVDLTSSVAEACGNAQVAPNSIIGVFRAKTGISKLCPNVVVTTVKPTSTPRPKAGHGETLVDSRQSFDGDVTMIPPSISPLSTNIVTDDPQGTARPTDPSSATPFESGGILMDTGSPEDGPRPTATFLSSSVSDRLTSTATSSPDPAADSEAESDENGGSPFDFQGGTVPDRALSGLLSAAVAVLVGCLLAL